MRGVVALAVIVAACGPDTPPCDNDPLCDAPEACEDLAATLDAVDLIHVGAASPPLDIATLPPDVALLVSSDELVELLPPAGSSALRLTIAGCGPRPRVRIPGLDLGDGGLLLAHAVTFEQSHVIVRAGATAELHDTSWTSPERYAVTATGGGHADILDSRFEGGGLLVQWGSSAHLERLELVGGLRGLYVEGDQAPATQPVPEDEASVEAWDLDVHGQTGGSAEAAALGVTIAGRSDVLIEGATIEGVAGAGLIVARNPGDALHTDPDSYRVVLRDVTVSGMLEAEAGLPGGTCVETASGGEAWFDRLTLEGCAGAGIVISRQDTDALLTGARISAVRPLTDGNFGRCLELSWGAQARLEDFAISGCRGVGVWVGHFSFLDLDDGSVEQIRFGRDEQSGIGMLALDASQVFANGLRMDDVATFGIYARGGSNVQLSGSRIERAPVAAIVANRSRVSVLDGSVLRPDGGYGIVGWTEPGDLLEARVVLDGSSIEQASPVGLWFGGGDSDDVTVQVTDSQIDGTTLGHIGALPIGGHAIQLVDVPPEADVAIEGVTFGPDNVGAGVFLSASHAALVGNDYESPISVWQQRCEDGPVDLADDAGAAPTASLCEAEQWVHDPTIGLSVTLPGVDEGPDGERR